MAMADYHYDSFYDGVIILTVKFLTPYKIHFNRYSCTGSKNMRASFGIGPVGTES